MKTILGFVILLLIAVGAIAFLKAMKRKSATDEGEIAADKLPEFYGKPPMTEIEQVMYHRLASALPDCIVLGQVQVSQIVGIKSGPLWQTWFNKISRKSVDFVVCQKDFSIIAAIELDDSSHDTDERKAKDADKDTALKGAGVRLIRCRANQLPTTDAIQKMFHALIPLVR